MPPTGHQALTAPVTAANCSSCHPETVNTNGTINVAGGKHMNGLSEYSGGHPAGWAAPTQHGYEANQQGLQNCTSCHVAFGAASGVATSSCNACHGGTAWQTNCTFCHGTAGRTGFVAGTDVRLAAAPPVGPQGQTLTSDPLVGAHQRHVNPPATGRMAAPLACTNCHPSPLPADVAHVDGLDSPVPVPFGGIAITGNVTPSFNATTLGCSATYCHGNFTGGKTAAVPTWTGGAVTCTSCHNMPATSTGRHSLHMGRSGISCATCHAGIATGTGNPSTNAAITGPTLHVNGVKNVAFGGTYNGNTVSGTYTPSTRNCAVSCHGSETWL
jgi:predicted CxxxxCH...CXXCH cytochrome family protein